MRSNYRCAIPNGNRGECETSGVTIGNGRIVQRLSYKGLSGGTDKQRKQLEFATNLFQTSYKLEIMLERLAKAKSWVDNDLINSDIIVNGNLDAALQPGNYFGKYI